MNMQKMLTLLAALAGLMACGAANEHGERLEGAINAFECEPGQQPVGGPILNLEDECVTSDIYQTGCLAPDTGCTTAFRCVVNPEGLAVMRSDGCTGTGGDAWSDCPPPESHTINAACEH